MNAEREIWIEGDGVRLDARLHEGAGALSVAVLHPHPQYGGDMDNHVVVAVAGALAGMGATTLRFNFRGVGRSSGDFAGGVGEADDAVAAVRFLRERESGARVLIAGYSFGAMVASAIAGRVRPDGVLLISPPVAYSPLVEMPAGIPVLVIAGDRDTVAPVAGVSALRATGVEVRIVPGADHGWWPGLESLTAEATNFAEEVVSHSYTPSQSSP